MHTRMCVCMYTGGGCAQVCICLPACRCVHACARTAAWLWFRELVRANTRAGVCTPGCASTSDCTGKAAQICVRAHVNAHTQTRARVRARTTCANTPTRGRTRTPPCCKAVPRVPPPGWRLLGRDTGRTAHFRWGGRPHGHAARHSPQEPSAQAPQGCTGTAGHGDAGTGMLARPRAASAHPDPPPAVGRGGSPWQRASRAHPPAAR